MPGTKEPMRIQNVEFDSRTGFNDALERVVLEVGRVYSAHGEDDRFIYVTYILDSNSRNGFTVAYSDGTERTFYRQEYALFKCAESVVNVLIAKGAKKCKEKNNGRF